MQLDTRIVKNDVKARQSLKIEEDYIIALKKSYIVLNKNLYESSEKGVGNIELLCNFTMYIEGDEENVVHPFTFNLDFQLPIYYSYSENYGSEDVVLVISPNTKLLKDNFYRNDVNVAYKFFIQMTSGKFNDDRKLSYDQLLLSIMNIMKENEIKGHSSLEFEILLQGLCRDAKVDKPYRLTAKMNNTHKDFKMINVRDIPRYESAFNAISAENVTQGLLKTLNRENNIGIASPLERIALSKR